MIELRSRSSFTSRVSQYPDGELQPIAASLAQHPKSTTFLRLSSGTGRGGGYSEVDLRKCPILEALRSALTTAINETLHHDRMLGQKVVVTRYGVGGVNWAHADQSEGGYQAYLLMSRPGVDFTGGEFYITSPGAPVDDATRQIAWRMPGDLVIFAANAHECTADGREPRSWLHGFREVRSGSGGAESSHLCVVGLLERAHVRARSWIDITCMAHCASHVRCGPGARSGIARMVPGAGEPTPTPRDARPPLGAAASHR